MATAATKETSQENPILQEKSGAVLTLRFNRPDKLNTLTTPLCRELLHALVTAADDKSVRAIVLTGAGNVFSAGGDLHMIQEARKRRATREIEELLIAGKEICLAIATMPKLVIAAVNGVAA